MDYKDANKLLELYEKEFEMTFNKKQRHLMCSFFEWATSKYENFICADIIRRLFQSLDRYHIYYGGAKGTYCSREELNFDNEKDGN